MTLPEDLPKYKGFTEAKVDADLKGVIDPDVLIIPGPKGKELSKLFAGFETAYLKSGADLTSEKILNLSTQALANLWNGLSEVDSKYLEAVGLGDDLPGVDISKAPAPPAGGVRKPDTEILQESLDIYLGLTYSYATEIFSHLILEEYKTAPPGVDPADNPEYEKNARKFAQKFFELTGVKLIPEMIDAQSEQAKNRIEEAFDLIVRSERMIRGDPTNQDWAFGALDGEKINQAGIMPLVKKFFPEQEGRWSMIFNLIDSFGAGCKAGGLEAEQFAWRSNWAEARQAAASEMEFAEIRRLADLPEVKPIVEEMENIFKEPQEYDVVYINEDGSEINYSAIPANDREKILKDKKKKLADPSNPNRVISKRPPALPAIRYDYAQHGDPMQSKMIEGVLKAAELVKLKHPDTPGHIIGAAWMISIVGELRLKHFIDYYSRYLKSPDATFDAAYPITIHAPMARILYAIRAYEKIPPKQRLLWQILRLPKQGGDNQELATPDSTRDRKNYPNHSLPHTPGTIPPELDMLHPSYDGLEDEYLPLEAPLKPGTNKQDKDNPETAVFNKFVSEAIEVRTMVDYALTREEKHLTPVRLPNDLVLLPTYWETLFPDPSNPDKYADISFKQYNDACQKFDEFLNEAQNPGKFESYEDVRNIPGNLIRKISPFKGLFGFMRDNQTERGARFIRVLQEIMLRVIKNTYDQFMDEKVEYRPKISEPLTKHKYFIEAVIKEVQQGTNIPEIRDFLVHSLEKADELGLVGLFSDQKGNPFGAAAVGMFNYKESVRREELYEHYYSEEPPPDEKK